MGRKRMSIEEINAKLVNIIRSALNDNTIEAGTEINEIALDSLRAIKIVIMIEKTFGIRFENENLLLHNYERVYDIGRYIEGKMV